MITYDQDSNFINNVNSNIFHAFFKRNGGVSQNEFRSLNCGYIKGENKVNVIKNRILVCKTFSMPLSNLKLVNQVHSNKIVEITKDSSLSTADGMITEDKDLILGILTADCAPIIFSGKVFYGILHVGWKGLLNNIIPNLVRILDKKKEPVSKVICSVGPHLIKKSFEVKEDFIKLLEVKKPQLSDSIFSCNSKLFFDFSKSLETELLINGFKNFNILKTDTFLNNNQFYSYRFSQQQQKSCGRQISIIGKYK